MHSQTQSNKIGLPTAIIMCMNAMIGAGIFSTPSKLATQVGPAGLLTYGFVIVSVIFMALSLARVAQLYPQEGAFYTYTKPWAGHIGGILASGAYVIGVTIALGLITQITADNIHKYIPSLSPSTLTFLIISLLLTLNMIGVKFVQAGQMFLLFCTLFALISTIILGFANANFKNLFPFMPHGITSVISASKTAIFAFFGFESAASLYNIVARPEKNVPRALILSITLVGILYMAFIGAITLAIPGSIFTSDRMPLSLAIEQVFPNYSWLANLIGITIITSLLGVLQSMLYSVSMLTYSFTKLLQNQFAKNFVKKDYSFKIILLFISAWTLLNAFIVKNMDLFFSLTSLFIVFAFSMSILTLVIKKHDRTITEKIITFFGLLTAVIIFISAFIDFLKAINII